MNPSFISTEKSSKIEKFEPQQNVMLFTSRSIIQTLPRIGLLPLKHSHGMCHFAAH